MGPDEHDVWLNTVELVFGRVRVTKLNAIEYLKRYDVVIGTFDALFEVPDDGQTVYWVTFKTAQDHTNFLEHHGQLRSGKLGDIDVRVACSDKSLHYRDVLMSKIPPNFNLEVVKTILKNYGQVSKCEWEVYVDRAMGDLVGCKTGFIKIRMVIDKHMPSYLNVGPYRAYVTYRNQPITCRGCDARGHTWFACPSRRRRRGPAGSEPLAYPSNPPAPPRTNPPAPTRTNNPSPPAMPARNAEPRGAQKPATDESGFTEVTYKKRRANSRGSSPEESAQKSCRTGSVGELVAQAVSDPPAAMEGARSYSATDMMNEDLPPLPVENNDADMSDVSDPATTHVSETQVSLFDEIQGLAEAENSYANVVSGSPQQPRRNSAVIQRRPSLPTIQFSPLRDADDY